MAIADVGLGAQLGLRDLLMQRMAQQQYADRMRQQQFENQRQLAGDSRADQQVAESSSLRRAMEADAATQKGSAEANALGEQIPANTFLPETDPGVATMQKYGRGFLLTRQEGRPAVTEGPLLPGDTGAERPQGFIKTATQKQTTDAASADRKDWEAGIKQQVADLKAGQQPTSSYQLQPEIDPKTGQQTGRFLGYNTKANRFEPVSGGTPQATKAAPGAAQNAQHEQAKTEALGSLDQLDQAIEAAKDLVGPGAGRVSSIQQMIGNPDPRISALGTKMLLAKMQVDHAASGTVRAGASPQILSRWDNILGTNQTPEGLKASVQAMREILGGHAAPAASGGTVPMIAPDGRSLNVPADKVAELEAKGAKRR